MAIQPVSNLARVLSFGVGLPFMVYGLLLALVRGEQVIAPGRRPEVLLLGLFALVYASIHLLSWALVRYRLPVDAVLVLFAGLALSRLSTLEPVGRFAGSVRRGGN